MKRFPVALLVACLMVVLADARLRRYSARAVLSRPSASDVLDRYGGSPRLRCTNKTGHFILTKIGKRWWFCDPAGNAFISMSVSNVLPNRNPTFDCQGSNTFLNYITKYGDATYNWGWQTLKRVTSWGFNSIGQDSGPNVLASRTCPRCPWPGGRQPIPLPYLSESKPAENASINRNGFLSEPIKDEISGTNANYSTWRGGALYDVFDPKLDAWWKKALAGNSQIRDDPYILGVLTDDSDYFWGAGAGPDFATGHTNANIAWVTLITSPVQTYTQSTPFGSKKFLYQITQNYTKTLATNPTIPCSFANPSTAKPCSLRDYLWQKYTNSGALTNTQGIAALNTAWGSNYTSFDSVGTQVTGKIPESCTNSCSGDGLTKTFTGTLAHTPISPYSVLIFVGGTAQIGDCPWFHGGCSDSTSNTGSLGSPTVNYITQSSSSINYSTGAITISFVTAPARGTSITVNYTYGGWMAGGTGLMDEDGSHTAWVGTNPFCLEGADPNYPTYFSCVGGGGNNNPVPNANSTLGADLDNWVPQMAAKYFKTMHDDLRAVSSVPYLGLDLIGSWSGPAYSKFLQGAAPYLDVAFVGLHYWAPAPSPATFKEAYQYTTRYLGDIPLLNYGSGGVAQADSSYYCHALTGPNAILNQATRGENYYNAVNYLLTTPGYNGTYPFVGNDWWSWQDFQNLNQGLVSLHDNAYDGHEAVTGRVPCSPPLQNLTCGGEAANYGDAIGKVRQANALWYDLLP